MNEQQFSPETVERLMAKLPKPTKGIRTYLPAMFFRNLSDEEFTIMFYSPGMEFLISEKCAEYIIKRADELKLKKGKHTHFKNENIK